MRVSRKTHKITRRLDRGDNSDEFEIRSDQNEIPKLKYGANTNLAVFKQKLSVKAMQVYGDIARSIETGKYNELTENNVKTSDLADDPYGLNIVQLTDGIKANGGGAECL